MHNQSVGVWQIQSRLHDRRRQKNVIAPVVEGGHDVLKLASRHLARSTREGELGHCLAQKFGDLVKVGDTRCHVERLAAAIALTAQRVAHDHRIEGRDIGSDR